MAFIGIIHALSSNKLPVVFVRGNDVTGLGGDDEAGGRPKKELQYWTLY